MYKVSKLAFYNTSRHRRLGLSMRSPSAAGFVAGLNNDFDISANKLRHCKSPVDEINKKNYLFSLHT